MFVLIFFPFWYTIYSSNYNFICEGCFLCQVQGFMIHQVLFLLFLMVVPLFVNLVFFELTERLTVFDEIDHLRMTVRPTRKIVDLDGQGRLF